MKESILKAFFYFGLISAGICAAVIISVLLDWIKARINDLKIYWRFAHRFDKAPCAECRCIGCKYWEPYDDGTSGYCSTHRWNTADCWFCWDAEKRPLKDWSDFKRTLDFRKELYDKLSEEKKKNKNEKYEVKGRILK